MSLSNLIQFVNNLLSTNMDLILLTTFSGLLGVVLFKFVRDKWKLHQLKIPYFNERPFFIEIFYPLWKIAIASSEERLQILSSYSFKYPDMMKLWLGPKLKIFLNNPDRIQKVFMSRKCLEKFNLFYNSMNREHGLIAASVKRKWKEHRKFFNFSFSSKIIENFTPLLVNCSEVFCDKLENEVESGKEFDFSKHARKASFAIICATLFRTNVQDKKNAENYEEIFNVCET